MLSIQLFKVIADERERNVQQELRIRRLLRGAADVGAAPEGEVRAAYRDSWRARTPRASATTR